jgi:diguanylate cyclase (GGDEF)-like protein
MDLRTHSDLEVNLDSNTVQVEMDASVVNRARNNFILSNQKSSILVVLPVILTLALGLRPHVDPLFLGIWTSVCILIYLARFWLCHTYEKSADDVRGESHWESRFTATVVTSGLIWGASAFVIFPESSKNHQILLVLVIVFLCAGTIVAHSAYKVASVGFALTSLVPFIAKFFVLNEEGLSETAFFLGFFLVVMITSGTKLRKTANKIFTLSYENNKLIYELKASNGELLEKNDLLSETQQALREVNDELQKLATTDALTGLTNRRRFEALTKVKWARCAENKTPISLLLINIDHFKQYNDFYGQRKGDSCLISIGELLRSIPEINRSGDALARYAGDELAVLLIDANASYAEHIAGLICEGVEKLRLSRAELPNEVSPWITVSVGFASEEAYRERSFEELFSSADEALHRAKRAGRNRITG